MLPPALPQANNSLSHGSSSQPLARSQRFRQRKFAARARASFESVEIGIFVRHVGRRIRTWRQNAGREARGECPCPNSHLQASSPLARRSMAPPAPGRQPCSPSSLHGGSKRGCDCCAGSEGGSFRVTHARAFRAPRRDKVASAPSSRTSASRPILGCRPVRGGRHRVLFAAKRAGRLAPTAQAPRDRIGAAVGAAGPAVLCSWRRRCGI